MDTRDDDAWYLEARPPVPQSERAYVALGSNLGDPSGNVIRAASALNSIPGVRVIATSRLYQTRPVGIEDQPEFTNAVADLHVNCNARDLLEGLLALERKFGRNRSQEQRWGPRTLDLDLLLFRGQTIDEQGLVVPHPRMAERRFVLEPLADLAPALVPPGWSRSIARTLEALAERESQGTSA